MTNTRQIPTALSVVSYLFFAMGILALVDMIGSAFRGSFNLDFNLLGLWICAGLRRYSLGWRTCALVFVWLDMIALAFCLVYGFVGRGPAFIKIFGQHYADIPVIWVSVTAMIFSPLVFWMYRVLTRPNIRVLFYDDSQKPAA
jgi:hypothetical protein